MLISLQSLLTEFVFFKKKINKANNKLTTLFTKMMCFQNLLNQTNHHTTEKINCLVAELDSDNNEIKNEINSFNIQQFIDFMSLFF
jgi:hypothetical protein